MFKLDGSEISWLIYCDWLEDQDIDAKHIRALLEENETNSNQHFTTVICELDGMGSFYREVVGSDCDGVSWGSKRCVGDTALSLAGSWYDLGSWVGNYRV